MTSEAREQEIWKVYPEYPWIEASNLGRIRTKDRIVTDRNGRKYHIKGRVLKQKIKTSRGGYMYVTFKVNGKAVCLRVHRIVAICFIPNPNNYPEVNHIDCDRTNNRVDNLEWCTREYNIVYREKYGMALNRPVVAINPDTSEVFLFKSQREAGRQLNIYQTYISAIVRGKQNSAGGFYFCNADENAVEKTRVKFGDKIAEKVEKLMNERKII